MHMQMLSTQTTFPTPTSVHVTEHKIRKTACFNWAEDMDNKKMKGQENDDLKGVTM